METVKAGLSTSAPAILLTKGFSSPSRAENVFLLFPLMFCLFLACLDVKLDCTLAFFVHCFIFPLSILSESRRSLFGETEVDEDEITFFSVKSGDNFPFHILLWVVLSFFSYFLHLTFSTLFHQPLFM